MYTPDFPTRNYLELQKSKIQIGDKRHLSWETTYNATMRPLTHQDTRQSLDTVTLQRTHWTPGDIPGSVISECHDKYRDFGTGNQRETSRTRDQMMRTSFNLGDGSPMESRRLQKYERIQQEPIANLRNMMESTHFDLKNPQQKNTWESTNKADFRPFTAKPSESADMSIMRGYGAKSTFDQMGAFGPQNSSNRTDFVDYSKRPGTTDIRTRSVTIDNGRINFEQSTTNKWQRTNWQMGDTEKRYTTTMKDGIQPHGVIALDPKYAQEKRIAFHKSVVTAGNNLPPVKTSTMHDAIQAHPDFKPPDMADKTAFMSHHDFRNWNEKVSTTSRDAFQPKKAEPVAPVNNQLQRSHANFGDSKINEKRTLFMDSYKKPPPTLELADMQAARDFHQGHHTNNRSGMSERTEITTNQATYTGFPDCKPSEICDALRGGRNIVQNEPRFTVRTSAMHDAFVPHKYKPPEPIDNNLQKSHIQLQGNGTKWSTTQQDYFQFKTYRMPGQPQ
ncbi:hypothetical protein TRFO_25425 [Tritrichomonas foetus]|uniref:Uncharacterized protein n=1 Tax=Tritrichomonas foetus TaxID=1144522 RepID=A0A1J4K6C0_9EUKA|nr:hypothetical protein TRFO_25425 [Tritrichomonas foetus]|eukprot:OHT06538.1 hypothetical protein TRFO_25425 [Tritrichomonas foetus]